MINNRQVYNELLLKLLNSIKVIDKVLNDINKYEIMISKGLIINETVGLKQNLNNTKEDLIRRKEKIQSEIVPALRNAIMIEKSGGSV